MQDEISISFDDLFFVFKKFWKWILSSAILGAILIFIISEFILPKKYVSALELYVNNFSDTGSTGNLNINDLNASQKLVSTYIVILKNDQVMKQILEDVDGITEDQLLNSLTMSSVDNTEVLRISAETQDPQLSADICNRLADIAPDVLTRVVKAGSVEIIAPAVPSKTPSSPNTKKNVAIGTFGFLIVSYLVFFIVSLCDTTVKGEDDIKQRTNLTVLGEIPFVES